MDEGLRELPWRVSVILCLIIDTVKIILMPGDVSISAEDRPLVSKLAQIAPVSDYEDGDEYDELEEEEHPHSTSLRFLLAGGMAGAGSFFYLPNLLLCIFKRFLDSIANVHGSV